MAYENTQVEIEELGDCSIYLQCHARESIRGWAFRATCSGLASMPDWTYGYSSKEEARNTAIDLIEEYLKGSIRRTEKTLAASQSLLAIVHEAQRQRSGIYN